jgi:CheY-like chemotaxis protein/HPt (histidine-containing phosphotransfer) domain-containing protein
MMDATETYRILVVDDTETNLDMLVDTLGDDYDVSVALDGAGALEAIETEHPDLILLDIMMPGMDGYEVCRVLKSKPATRDIPVIFVTAMGEVEDEVKGFELGAVDYITKPVSPPRLLARVKTYLRIRETQRQLEAQNASLIENARLREDVDGIMRHDLKTPLNSIVGLPPIIREEAELNTKHNQALKTIEASGYRMLNMINLSLDLLKMERGTYAFQPEAVDIMGVTRRICEELRSMAEANRNELRLELNGKPADTSAAFHVFGEELLCYSMLANLAKNAVEASPEGKSITIRIDSDVGSKVEQACIRVSNSGAVPAEIRDRFFEKHVTAGKSGGTGLGTYSARLIAETQLGRIGLESSREKGTEITVWLPLCAQPTESACRSDADSGSGQQRVPERSLPPLSILLVDDDPFNIQLFETFLNDPRFQTESAANGKIALERLASSNFDIVLMDMEMPVLNGIETIQRIRSREALEPDPQKHVKIVALSAHDDPAIVDRCLSAGFDDYLQKPVGKADILRVLHRFFTSEPEMAAAGEKSGEPGNQPESENQSRPSPAAEYTVIVDADLEDLVPGFLEKKQEELEELRGSLAEKNFERVRQLGHKLKGTFNMYGFESLSDACAAIESAAVQEEDGIISDQLDVIDDFMENMSIEYISS